MKLENLAKYNFENEFLGMVLPLFTSNNYLLTELERRTLEQLYGRYTREKEIT